MRKIIYGTLIAITAFGAIITGCQKEKTAKLKKETLAKAICDGKLAKKKDNEEGAVVASVLPYNVSLLSRKADGNGNYVWTWTVTNPNPGNGENNTVQDLSHWGITLGKCAQLNNIVLAEYSTDGEHWTSFSPAYKEDKSQDCYSGSVLKFDEGTDGSKTSYYRLTVNINLPMAKVLALYKSGSRTGCGTFEICGFGDCVK